VSYFNNERICESCKEKEKMHPRYEQAVEADHIAVMSGNYDFPGIGKPDDL
jgi:hypothetical protein